MKKTLKKYFPKIFNYLKISKNYKKRVIDLYDIESIKLINERQHNHPNQFVRYGKKVYSQTDEDGITKEIIERLGISKGSFAEFGVGNGIENNTLFLACSGWKGFWVGGEDIILDLSKKNNLLFLKRWIKVNNIVDLFKEGLSKINKDDVDLISLDLDGNDLFFCKELLKNDIKPKVFIVEYNAKFPPPLELSIDYDENHSWGNDDYMGASLASINKIFSMYEYSLICCNAASGANAFFIQNQFRDLFPEVPSDINKIYSSPNYILPEKYGQHKISIKSIDKLLS